MSGSLLSFWLPKLKKSTTNDDSLVMYLTSLNLAVLELCHSSSDGWT